MAKRNARQTSVKKRREAYQQQQAERQRQMRLIGGVFAVLVLLVVGWWFTTQFGPAAETVIPEGERPLASLDPADRVGIYDQYPDMVIDTAQDYEAVITMADGGEMRLRLFDDEAPLAVNNFVFLANQGYYDNTTFHRVLPDFMAQAGDPGGTGGGGPGYQFADETDNGLTFDRPGLLAMANAGPNTNGGQFFITYEPTPHLNGAHTIFGELVAGEDVLDSLTPRDPTENPSGPGDTIERITIVES